MQKLSKIFELLEREVALATPDFQVRIADAINKTPLVTDYTDANGCTILMTIVLYRPEETDLIRFVLNRTNNLGAKDIFNKNILHIASEKGLSLFLIDKIITKIAEKKAAKAAVKIAKKLRARMRKQMRKKLQSKL